MMYNDRMNNLAHDVYFIAHDNAHNTRECVEQIRQLIEREFIKMQNQPVRHDAPGTPHTALQSPAPTR